MSLSEISINFKTQLIPELKIPINSQVGEIYRFTLDIETSKFYYIEEWSLISLSGKIIRYIGSITSLAELVNVFNSHKLDVKYYNNTLTIVNRSKEFWFFNKTFTKYIKKLNSIKPKETISIPEHCSTINSKVLISAVLSPCNLNLILITGEQSQADFNWIGVKNLINPQYFKLKFYDYVLKEELQVSNIHPDTEITVTLKLNFLPVSVI